MSTYIKDHDIVNDFERTSTGVKLYERIGGRPTLDKVHKHFYDALYRHPWLGQFFAGVNQAHIEAQQSDFMAQLMGGPKAYAGRMPTSAHMHMYITEELLQTRRELLTEALFAVGVAEAERMDWLRLDGAFKKVILKERQEDCQRRFATDNILSYPSPDAWKKAS